MSTAYQNKASIGGVTLYNNRTRLGLILLVTQSFAPQREERLRDESKERLGSDATHADARVFRMRHVRGLFRFTFVFILSKFFHTIHQKLHLILEPLLHYQNTKARFDQKPGLISNITWSGSFQAFRSFESSTKHGERKNSGGDWDGAFPCTASFCRRFSRCPTTNRTPGTGYTSHTGFTGSTGKTWWKRLLQLENSKHENPGKTKWTPDGFQWHYISLVLSSVNATQFVFYEFKSKNWIWIT